MKLLGEQQRIEIAELIQMLERNKNRLDAKQYEELEKEINKKIVEIRNER